MICLQLLVKFTCFSRSFFGNHKAKLPLSSDLDHCLGKEGDKDRRKEGKEGRKEGGSEGWREGGQGGEEGWSRTSGKK